MSIRVPKAVKEFNEPTEEDMALPMEQRILSVLSKDTSESEVLYQLVAGELP
jgi:hypothetical protein